MNIEVVGRHALMFDDDSMAAFVNSGDALVEWNSLQIDRYDVRHLLSCPLPPRRRRSHQPTGDSSLNSELDHERYLDLPSEEPEIEEQEAEKLGDGSLRAVGFSYGDVDHSADQRNAEEGLDCRRFQPPFSVPESIVHDLPPTKKVHQIIARTATFVSQHGAQSEIVLRVKQGDNPTFGFLMPHHNLHPYFRFLVDHQEVLQSGSNVNSQSGNVSADQKKMDTGGALSLLGSAYGTEDDDEDAQEIRDAASGDMNRNSSLDSHVAEKTESSTNALPKDKVVAESPLHSKDRPPAVKKNPSMIVSKGGRTGNLKEGDVSGSCSASTENNDKPLILEPPADIKILVDKIVDFITNNGKQFEAALREQDSKQGRFPFLVPSDQYHTYYLKVLKKSEESKQGVKSSSGNLVHLGLYRKVSSYKEDGVSSLYSDMPYESDRKEKFKMSAGKSKKDMQDQQSKATQQEGGIKIDDEAAAAIFQAATRCFKNPYAGINSSSSLNEIQHGGDVRQDSGQKSSSSDTKAILKPDISETSSHPESDYNLTKEQKLKAERLRRAKMFVAKLKSGAAPSKDEPLQSLSAEPLGPGTSVSPGEVNHDSTEGGSNPTLAEISPLEKRESSERKMLREENTEKQSRRKYRSRSDMHEDSDEEEMEHSIIKDRDERQKDEEKNHRHSRKKHRSRHSSDYDRDYKKVKSHSHRHSRKRHRSRGSSCEDDDGEMSSDSSAHRHSSKKKHSSHRLYRHYKDDDRKSEKHSRKRCGSHRSSRSSKENPNKIEAHSSGDEGHYEDKKRSASEKRGDLQEGEISLKVSDPSESTNVRASSQPSETPPPISDDLRAKIRAMLLSTMG